MRKLFLFLILITSWNLKISGCDIGIGSREPTRGSTEPNTPAQGAILQTTAQNIGYYAILAARTCLNLWLMSLRLASSSRFGDLSPNNLLPGASLGRTTVNQTTTQDVGYYTILTAWTCLNLCLMPLRLPSSSRSGDLSPNNLLLRVSLYKLAGKNIYSWRPHEAVVEIIGRAWRTSPSKSIYSASLTICTRRRRVQDGVLIRLGAGAPW